LDELIVVTALLLLLVVLPAMPLLWRRIWAAALGRFALDVTAATAGHHHPFREIGNPGHERVFEALFLLWCDFVTAPSLG
jgi:hypothetical protein